MSLGLAATIRAEGPGAAPGRRGPERATLLAGAASVGAPTQVSDDTSLRPPALLDINVIPAQARTAEDAEPQATAPGNDALPAVAPLPAMAQATPAAGRQAGTPSGSALPPQTGAGNPPAPPAARPPSGPQTRTQPAPSTQPNGKPAVDVNQQVQFDKDGLVTMHTNELDVRQLLELLSRRSGMNILVSPKVSGPITANFEGVTVEKVLDAIVKLANLTKKVEGSIHYIYTKEELQDEAEFTKKERILTKVYKLNYVRADEILGVIRPFLSADVGQKRMSVTPSYKFGISESATFVAGGGQAMSAGGASVSGGTGGPGGAPPTGGGPTIGGFQPPTGGNSLADFDHLIIQDYESNLKIIDQIIERLDIRPVQVLIEAVIISVDYEHDRELGVNLGLVDNLGRDLGTIGSGTALNGNTGFTPKSLLTAAGTIASGTVTDPQGFTSGTNGIKFGFVSNNVTGFIRALETIGSTKILASPRILVLNKQRAEIQLGERLGFQTLSQNFTSTIQQVQFLNTGTLLRLRPFISNDGMVRMEIHPERSSGVVNNNIPNQFTAELTTNVLVPDGATLVLGGLIEDEDDFNYQGLPLLSRFPALGFLTGVRQKQEGRRELVVLLTPHIWSPEQAMAHAPPAHSPTGPFGPNGPMANGATTFDLETGRVAGSVAMGTGPGPGAGHGANPAGAAGIASSPAAGPAQGAAAAGPAPGGDASPPAMLASADPGTAGATAAAGPADPNRGEPPASQRRRRSALRDWFSRRTRGKEADPSADPGVRAQASTPAAIANATPPSGTTSEQANGVATAPPSAEGPTAPASPEAAPIASPQQATPSPGTAQQRPQMAPLLTVPVSSTMNEGRPRKDPMLAQAAWNMRREDTSVSTGRSDRVLIARQSSHGPEDGHPRGVVAGPRRHTLAPGETFGSIARVYYGSEQLGESLREYNRGRISRGGLQPGDLLVIPPREELPSAGGWVVQAPARSAAAVMSRPRGRTPEARPYREADADGIDRQTGVVEAELSSSRREAARPAPRPRAIYHVVGPDETPRSIARDRLGDATRAAEIINLNHALLTSEGRWKPGLRILLPPDAE